MERLREMMFVTRFLSGLPDSYGPLRSQIWGGKELHTLEEVFHRLCQASIATSTSLPQAVVPSSLDRSAYVVFGGSYSTDPGPGSGRGSGGGRFAPRGGSGHTSGGRGASSGRSPSSSDRGRGRGHGSRYCTHCHADNHTVDYCWKLYGRPAAYYAEEETQGEASPSTSSTPTAGYAHQTPPPRASLASHSLWIIDSGASQHMAGASYPVPTHATQASRPPIVLADGSTSAVDGSTDRAKSWVRVLSMIAFTISLTLRP